jgi:hypothetical protein
VPQASQIPLPLDGVAKIRERADRLMAKCRQRGTASLADIEQLVGELHTLADDSDYWYRKADFFRESYRLAKGLTDDELDARMVIDEATAPHPSPCRWPSSPDCTCGGGS